ncbi:unnamed protein product [Vicia faba]|uniref:Uncharacterized protein n=1 Tax=Vicia faba TaxID=3906 RepID=A0AAV0YKX9_VICFA|nr:unnamed protein product [Vicia faba]
MKWEAQVEQDLDMMLKKAKAVNERCYIEFHDVNQNISDEQTMDGIALLHTIHNSSRDFVRASSVSGDDDTSLRFLSWVHWGMEKINVLSILWTI